MADAAEVVVGIDAGGTKTAAIVCDLSGRQLGLGVAGPGNWEAVGLDAVRDALAMAVLTALRAAGATPSAVRASCYGLAGLDWPDDEARLDAVVATLGLGGSRTLVNDSLLPLRVGCRDGVGIASNAGTGSIACGRGRDGRFFRTFGVGYGERGGAGDLVRDALHAIAGAYHGRDEQTALRERFLAAVGCADVPALFQGISRGGRAIPRELAAVVLATAAAGDPIAAGIARGAGAGLAATAVGVARVLGMSGHGFDVVRSGSVHLAGCADLDGAFAAGIVAGLPRARLVTLEGPPALGAALLALDALAPAGGWTRGA